MSNSMQWPDVILVNGPSSAGKSTLCRALRARTPHPYLCAGFDDFIGFSAPRYYMGAGHVEGTPDSDELLLDGDFTEQGVRMINISADAEPPCVVARFGPVFRRLLDSMAPAVRALVDGGNSVIFDHVLHDKRSYESCMHAFEGLKVFRVGVHCPLEVLEARERARGDRVIGRARGLVDVVHTFCSYEAEVDTGAMDARACADKVVADLSSIRLDDRNDGA
ncbi:hypothetical protein K1W69_25880 [Hoeflea sp. WL0058]|uniref:Chloramphenicol 3-O phosphotransferase n=1 Tax=Flavimaribacter sediminis TaxID=2865987 RepID=A0AAE2ZRG5_9HYPH|nr:hypothetical protein [Flavimaribacter sediminis]MBW8640649.1 hypothetical protein [Flavimaribacter sediminis]